MLDFDTCYRAMLGRDPRFDGRFIVAVTTTGVYCRPVCPSRTPRPEHTRFFRVPAAAEAAGFRACRRCRPEVAAGSPEWNVRGDLVARALRLIAGGQVDEVGVAGLARRLAVSERHLHRQLMAEVGVGPQALARNRRSQVARLLIESTALPLADVAFASGYTSIRQFNDGMRAAFGCPPSDLRRSTSTERTDGGGPLVLRLRHRSPLHRPSVLAWLGPRGVPGVEEVEGTRYHRTLRLPRSTGVLTLDLGPVARDGQVTARLTLGDLRDVTAAVRCCRELLDLDADPSAIEDVLRQDPMLRPLVQARPGLRVPGCTDGYELAVRAVLGQQISVAAARTFAARIVRRWGEAVETDEPALTHLFPSPDVLADADLESVGLTGRRAATLRALSKAVSDGELLLDRETEREETLARLMALPGIGPWTAGYVAMRALGDPDAFPATDLGLCAAARRLGEPGDASALAERSERWRPWRSYAAMHLWASLT